MKAYMQKVWGRGMALFGKKRLVDWNDLFLTPPDLDAGGWEQLGPGLVESGIDAWPGSTCFALILKGRHPDLFMTEQIARGEDAAGFLREVATTIDTFLTELADKSGHDDEEARGLTARRISLPTLGDETVAWLRGTVTTRDERSTINFMREVTPPEDKDLVGFLDQLQGLLEAENVRFTDTSCKHDATAWVRIGNQIVIIVSLTAISGLEAMEQQQEVAVAVLEHGATAATLKVLKALKGMR